MQQSYQFEREVTLGDKSVDLVWEKGWGIDKRDSKEHLSFLEEIRRKRGPMWILGVLLQWHWYPKLDFNYSL